MLLLLLLLYCCCSVNIVLSDVYLSPIEVHLGPPYNGFRSSRKVGSGRPLRRCTPVIGGSAPKVHHVARLTHHVTRLIRHVARLTRHVAVQDIYYPPDVYLNPIEVHLGPPYNGSVGSRKLGL